MQCRCLFLSAMFAAIVTNGPAYGQADHYPTRPVRMIIPFAPGGASDFIGRILQPKLAEALGQQVVVDNRSGASGNIGVETAAQATPDGYTFLLGNVSAMGIGPSMFPKFHVRVLRDFIPITLVVDVPGALGIHGGLPPNNLKEFIAYAKANDKLSYGSAGYASAHRMAQASKAEVSARAPEVKGRLAASWEGSNHAA